MIRSVVFAGSTPSISNAGTAATAMCDLAVGDEVVAVACTDGDADTLTYSFDTGAPTSVFAIDAAGL